MEQKWRQPQYQEKKESIVSNGSLAKGQQGNGNVRYVAQNEYRKLPILRRSRKEDASVYSTRKSEKLMAESNTVRSCLQDATTLVVHSQGGSAMHTHT